MERTIDSYEIIAGLQGTLFMQQEDTRFEVKPGDVLTLLPGLTHTGYKTTCEPCSFLWLHFQCRGQCSVLSEQEAISSISVMGSSPQFNTMSRNILIPGKFTPGSKERVLIQAKQLLDVSENRYYTPYSADYQLTSLMIELTQQACKQAYNTPDLMKDRNFSLSSILEWISINLQKNISVKELSERFSYNSDHLSRLFKKHLGVTPVKYINALRILKAKELLSLTDKSIKEICYAAGFNDEKYFMKLFRRSENMTPSEYRQAYYKMHMNNS